MDSLEDVAPRVDFCPPPSGFFCGCDRGGGGPGSADPKKRKIYDMKGEEGLKQLEVSTPPPAPEGGGATAWMAGGHSVGLPLPVAFVDGGRQGLG